ncbi:snRNA-activating protein complex subunit 2 isoform X2 [Aquila chrysaetos chrysaetos]|uniref:snRNA-activating protein complex subunit 2 isoform X2 n=1 Tax=Aquila chrysaetos chrysaetos TaxID=223781 RepID=UPI0011764C00|nr:snRNA-activating protein complex subunit 2 isoform X2 [Aquila chrysaetos chrysaetos]
MKPPLRPRLAPARYVTGPGAAAEPERPRAAWSAREKRALLAALRAQAALGLPDLQPRPLRERLPRRSEAEVWLELAETLAEGLEEATAAAFSQVLTVAATEPLSLLHSIPPHPAGTTASLDQGGSALGDPAAPPAPQPHAPGAFTVDFQRVYEYLARLCRGGKGPALPPGESAVVLALLGSLPQELGVLDRAALHSHLRGAYGALTAPRPPQTDSPAPGMAPGAPPPPGNPATGWRGVGLCPLNLFLVPLRLLARVEPSG